MHVECFPLGSLDTNCFVVYTDTGAVVIDPGGPPGEVIRFLRERKLALSHILLTHLHYDHVAGVAELAGSTGAVTRGSEKDRYLLETELGRGGIWGMPRIEPYAFTDLGPGDLPLLGTTCTVLATPGHTPGGLSFSFPELKAVFAGDTLFRRSVGRADFPGGDLPVLLDSIRKQLFLLPEETTVYPGHGLETGIGEEKRNNPFAGDFGLSPAR
jgi:glyoxylase-like metal-dependent hydrolase (beta-lactamase superfamily II)